MDPWYKLVTPRKEVREGRSFNPDEFAIALEQVVSGNAPDDYKRPEQFFARTCFTRALRENSGLVVRRLAGLSENTAPVQTLVTQMGGGKTHMLTTLWHLANAGPAAAAFPGVRGLLDDAGLAEAPKAKVAVFVGNAWDPQPGRETPWIDIARQLAGEEGVNVLGPSAREAPPGTDTINRLIAKTGGPVLLLFDELLNLFTRHRSLAEPMHAFLHNIVRGFVGSSHRAAVISLPRSQVEMTDWDLQWQDKILKVVGAVAKPLLVNDEGEISEVIRRRLFENLDFGKPEAAAVQKAARSVSKKFADWCFERRAQLPPEWTAVDSTATEKKAKEYLQGRFEACYPFHPATLSVFQRKWQSLPQFQQTRGTLAMLAQWISWAFREGFTQARREPLITLGSAPLHVPEFRSVVLGQLGESRLLAAIDTDIAGERSHARALDADTTGVLRDIHRRVGTTILFESSGGQVNRVAHFPDLRFALGEPELDTTSVDTAATALEASAFFVQRVGADGFKVFHKAKIDKAVHDRRASLDDEEIRQAMRALIKEEFKRGASVGTEPFEAPFDAAKVSDSPKLSLWFVEPEIEWDGDAATVERVREWTARRGKSDRLYPGALIWCLKRPGRDLRDKVELLLAWRRVQRDVREGVLGADFERADHAEIQSKVADAEEDAKDEVWAGYRYVVLADTADPSGQKVIDLGAGHSSGSETLCGRVIAALKAEAMLNESVGAGYIDRNWPPAFKDSGAWPLASLRQSFLNGALTRLLDPDGVLRAKLAEFVGRGDFGLASGPRPEGGYERLWYAQTVPPEEVAFESGVVLLKKAQAEALKNRPIPTADPEPVVTGVSTPVGPAPSGTPAVGSGAPTGGVPVSPAVVPLPSGPTTKTVRLTGSVAPELWNRLGTRVLPKLKAGKDLKIGIDFSVVVDAANEGELVADLRQILTDLGLLDTIEIG
jgi:hypothetical protein